MKTIIKTITLQRALEILSAAEMIVVDGHQVESCFSPLSGEPENEFMFISWESDDKYTAIFAEELNEEVKCVDSSMFLFDLEGDCFQIKTFKKYVLIGGVDKFLEVEIA